MAGVVPGGAPMFTHAVVLNGQVIGHWRRVPQPKAVTIEAATSSYAVTRRSRLTTISDSVRDTRSEVCWTVVTPGDGYAFVTNFGDGTLSSYQVATDGSITLLDAVAAVTSPGELSVRDHGLSEDGRFLYAIDIHSQMVHGWRVGADGGLTEIGAFPGLPPTVAGLAAS